MVQILTKSRLMMTMMMNMKKMMMQIFLFFFRGSESNDDDENDSGSNRVLCLANGLEAQLLHMTIDKLLYFVAFGSLTFQEEKKSMDPNCSHP